MLRALVISPTPTWPLNFGNRKRVHRVCSDLKARGFDIHFVHYASESDWRDSMPLDSREKMKMQWHQVDHIAPSVPLHQDASSGGDHELDEWWDPALENHLVYLAKTCAFDLVIVNYVWLSRACELFNDCTLKIIDAHDRFAGRRQVLNSVGLAPEFFHLSVADEVMGLSRADMVVAIKEEERESFARDGVDAEIVTLGHLDDWREPQSPLQSSGYVTFGVIGAANNFNKQNFEAFFDVADASWSQLLPPLKVIVAGSVCEDLTVQSDFIEMVGYVDSVNEFYDSIDVAVIPMATSTGLKIKACEALSQGKAIVSHQHAMEGLVTTHANHRCPDFETMAVEMAKLAFEPSSVVELADSSRQSYEAVNEQIRTTMDHIVGRAYERLTHIVVVAEGYGDDSSLDHWLTIALLDRFDWADGAAVAIQLSDHDQCARDSRVICLTQDQLNNFVGLCPNANLVHLPKTLKDNARKVTGNKQVINEGSACEAGSNEHTSELGIEYLGDLLGHQGQTLFEQKASHAVFSGICVLTTHGNQDLWESISEGFRATFDEPISYVAPDTALNIRDVVQLSGGQVTCLPRLLLHSGLRFESARHALVYDFMRAMGVQTLDVSQPIDFIALTLSPPTQKELRLKYQESFFFTWNF